jgi:CubicO group peptidase (beta-lactamase class C family)
MKRYFLLFCLLLPIAVPAQEALPGALTKNIQARIDNGHSPSIAVGIIDAEGPRYYFFGTKTIGGAPVDEHTIYEIGSISKTFTGILLAKMVEEGKVSLDDPVQKYLPESVRMPKWKGQEITLGHLSDHTSSLPRLPANLAPADISNPYADYKVEDLYAFLNSYELPRAIGSAFEYSNLAQGLLGHVLARSSGKSYEELVIEYIAEPLEMKETKIELDGQMQKDLAPGHSQGVQVPNWDIPTLAGAGALRSSLHDMLIYLSANMGMKETDLYPAMQLSHQSRHTKQGNNKVGLAWVISKGSEGDIIWHNGGTGGYRTFAGFVKETGKGVVVLTNSNKGADDIGFHLLDSEAELEKK